jgi:integrase
MSITRRQGSIRQRGSSFEVRVFLGYETDPITGKRSRRNHTRTFDTLEKARKYLNEKLGEKDTGTFIEPSKESLLAYLTRWLDGRQELKKITARTRCDYAALIERYIKPAFEGLKLSEVTAVAVEALYTHMSAPREAGGLGLSAATVNHVHAILHGAFKKAVKQRLIPYNPAAATERPEVKRKQYTALTDRQVAALWQAARSWPGDPAVIEKNGSDPRTGERDRHYALFVVLAMCGLRPGEAYALRWSDLDLDEGLLHVRRTLVNRSSIGKHFEVPKTQKSARTLDLPSLVVEALKEHRKLQAAERLKAGTAWQDGDLVFCTTSGTPLEHQNVVNRHFKPLLRMAGLPPVRLYDLRHSYASLRHKAGHSLLQVSRGLGHSTIKLTGDTYSHLFREEERQAAADLDRLLSQALG